MKKIVPRNDSEDNSIYTTKPLIVDPPKIIGTLLIISLFINDIILLIVSKCA